MAAKIRKLIYLDSAGVLQPASDSTQDSVELFNIEAKGDLKSKTLQVTDLTTANGVMQTSSTGTVTSNLLVDANVASAAAIAGSKISPDFAAQNVTTTGNISGANGTFTGTGSFGEAVTLSKGATIPTGYDLTLTDLPSAGTDAANKNYVDQISAGVRYKIHAKYWFNGTKAALEAASAATAVLAANDRILIQAFSNDTPSAAAANGVWKWDGSALARPDDFNDEQPGGVFVFCDKSLSAAGAASDINLAFICNAPENSIIDTTAISFVKYSRVQDLSPTAPLSESADGLTWSLDIDEDTLQIASNKLDVKGLNSLFTIATVATTANVSAANLNTLTAGTKSEAGALHKHDAVLVEYPVNGTVNEDEAVTFIAVSGVTKVKRAGKDAGKCVGVVKEILASGNALVAISGSVDIGANMPGVADGTNVYLGADGGFSSFANIDPNGTEYATKVGVKAGSSLVLSIQEFGIKVNNA